MTLRAYLLVMSLATAAAWFGWVMVIMNQAPQADALMPLVFFYIALFLALTGTFALIGFFVRFHTRSDELPFRQVAVAFRQALSYAGMCIIILLLQAQRLLTIWNTIFLLGAFMVLELFFLTHKKHTTPLEISEPPQ